MPSFFFCFERGTSSQNLSAFFARCSSTSVRNDFTAFALGLQCFTRFAFVVVGVRPLRKRWGSRVILDDPRVGRMAPPSETRMRSPVPFRWRRDRTTCASRRSSTCTVPVCHDHSSASHTHCRHSLKLIQTERCSRRSHSRGCCMSVPEHIHGSTRRRRSMTLTTRTAGSKATLSCFCSSPFSQHEALTADHHQLERFFVFLDDRYLV